VATASSSSHPSFRLDLTSAEKIVGPKIKEVMVYGFQHAYYIEVKEAISMEGSPIQQVYDWNLGDPKSAKISQTSGRPLEKVRFNRNYKAIHRMSKSGITNLILENYKRRKEGLEIIPLIFCIGSTTPKAEKYNPKHGDNPPSPENIANRSSVVSYSELRRAYRLCKELEKSEEPSLREIAKVAQDTIKLVTVEKPEDSKNYRLTQVPHIWEDPRWKTEWEKRKMNPAFHKKVALKTFKWRQELLFRAHMFDFNKKYSANLTPEDFSGFTKEIHSLFSTLPHEPSECPNIGTIQRYFSGIPEKTEALLKKFHIPIEFNNFAKETPFKDMYERAKYVFLHPAG
jgi:hypothetical protein